MIQFIFATLVVWGVLALLYVIVVGLFTWIIKLWWLYLIALLITGLFLHYKR